MTPHIEYCSNHYSITYLVAQKGIEERKKGKKGMIKLVYYFDAEEAVSIAAEH